MAQHGFGSNLYEADHHDLVLAITSHLPHLIAYIIVGTAAQLENDTRSEVIKYSASGFRDFTRIVSSDPIMWPIFSSPIKTRCWKCWVAFQKI